MLPHTVLFRLASTVWVAFRTPRVSGTGDAQCTSPYRALLSNCAMQRMRVRSLPALLFLSEPVRAHGGEATRFPPAQAPESPYFPRFEAELGEMRENGLRTAPSAWFPRVTPDP